MADKRISQLVERTDIANNDVLPIVASGATTTNKVTVSTLQEWMQDNLDVGVTSVGLSMPSAFVVSASPVTTSGNIAVTGAGTVSQYIRGDGSLADFPQSSGGGGASVSYYLNGSVSQGTIGGVAYLEMSKTPILGAGTDFTINANGYIASFITDAGDPNLLLIPGGNWNLETYFAASSGGGTPSFYVELYKVDSGGTATLVASNSANPELIAFGTTTTAYFSSLAVPATTLTLTDRLALRYYVTHAGRTITLHTENSNLCQIITTFTTGLTALNGLTAQVQNFATGTSGTDFNISSSSATHTFNIPTASATNRGLLSSADWTSFSSDKVPYSGATGAVNLGYNALSASQININGGSPTGGSYLGFKHSTSVTTGTDGYTSMYTFGTNNIGFQSVSGATQKDFSFSMSGITAGVPGGRVYTLPDASGTLALTSNLGAYLPLAGGTLTGALGGTSATFSGDIQSNTRLAATSGTHSIIITPNLGSTNRIEAIGSLPLALVSAHPSITMAAGGTTPQFTLGSSGLVTLTGALNGTSASFSGNVTSSTNTFSLDNAGSRLTLKNTANTLGFDIGLLGGGGDATAYIYNRANAGLIFGTNNASQLTIASTGAATFSSSVNLGTNANAADTASLNIKQAGTSYNQGIYIERGGERNGYHMYIGGALDSLTFRRNYFGTQSDVMSLTRDGNVGIGTASPNRQLTISSSQAVMSFNATSYRNTTIGSDATGSFIVYDDTAAAYRMVINSGGNVGIGTASPSVRLQAENTINTTYSSSDTLNGGVVAYIKNASTTNSTDATIRLEATGSSSVAAVSISAVHVGAGSSDLTFGTRISSSNVTERMRITSGGAVLIGTTTSNNYPLEIEAFAGGSQIILKRSGAFSEIFMGGGSAGATQLFVRSGGSGGVRLDFGSTAWVSASDIRLKDIEKPIENAVESLSTLQTVYYSWKDSEDKSLHLGLIAQEVEEVFPELVSESSIDETKGVKYTELIPVLVAAIKELKAEIEALKSQING